MDTPMKLEISVRIIKDQYSTEAYTFMAQRSLLEHSKKEVEKRLRQATDIIVSELEHATFLKGHLASRANAAAAVIERMEAEKPKELEEAF